VLAAVRLRRLSKQTHRLQRVDTFGFYVPMVLGDEAGRFAKEQVGRGVGTGRCRCTLTLGASS
jgi:hypothetical protein